MVHFWMTLNCLKVTMPLNGDILLFTTKALGSHGSHLIDRVQQLAYIATFIGAHMILGMCTLTHTLIFSLPFLKVFKNFLVLRISYCLKTSCYIFDLYLFVLERDRFFTIYICFKEILLSDFS